MSDTCNKRIILYSIVLGVVSMALMLSYGLNKEPMEDVEAQEKIGVQTGIILIDGIYEDLYTASNLQQPLTISLPSDSVTERVQLSEEYAKHCVQLKIDNVPEDYFVKHPLTGNAEGVKDIICQYENGQAILSIYLTKLLACTKEIQGNEIKLSFVPLREVYNKIIVVDAGHGGEEKGLSTLAVREKDITLNVVLELKKMLDGTDIKVLYTRLEDEIVAKQTRIELANEANADLFLSIHCALNEGDKECYGITTYYNETFFIPDFGNADFAYEVEEKTVRAVSGKALGLEPGEKYSELLKNSMVPTAYVEIGYLSNERESELLQQDVYVKKVARGLYEAIVSSYEKMKQ